MINTGVINATTVETSINLNGLPKASLIIACDSTSPSPLMLSINDNLHYQTYNAGEIIPLTDSRDNFNVLYVKVSIGTGTGRYWITG